MVAGRLDQRLSFWAREDGGADGFVRPVYVYQGTYWGRVDVTGASENIGNEPQSHVSYRSAARGTVADYVAVPLNGIVRIEDDTAVYWVRGVVRLRQLRAQRLDLQVVTPTEVVEFAGFEGLSTLDGVHLLTTDEFSSAFNEAFS